MTKYRVPRWVAIGVPLVFLLVGAFCLVVYWPWITRPRIGPPQHPLPHVIETGVQREPDWREFEERFIGHKEEDISARFGPPTERFEGHYGSPPLTYVRKYPEAHSWVYAARGGSLYLSFCKQRGRWVCFAASWLPEGSAF